MFSIINFLFSQSQFFNFILLESESKTFTGSIIQEVNTGGSTSYCHDFRNITSLLPYEIFLHSFKEARF